MINDKTMLKNDDWLGNLFLGDRINCMFQTRSGSGYDRSNSFRMKEFYHGDTITFQATTKTILFEGMAIPSGARVGVPIVFKVVAPKDD